MRQKTIAQRISCSGIGLHKGGKVSLTLHPAPEDTGIRFLLHTDEGTVTISPTPESAVDTSMNTTLGEKGKIVATVEHLMAAVRAMGVDNIIIEVAGGEMPIMDGSAAPFVFLIRSAGVREQRKGRRWLRVTTPFSFGENGKSISVKPHDGFFVDYVIDFPHPLIGRQRLALEVTPDSFAKELAKARTFGFLREVELLRKNGLALGGSLENAVVLDEYEVVNPEGLRFEDEFVRHKMLDFIGDMALAPYPVRGHFTVSCSGHAMNNAFLRSLSGNGALLEETARMSGEERVTQTGRLPGRMVAASASA